MSETRTKSFLNDLKRFRNFLHSKIDFTILNLYAHILCVKTRLLAMSFILFWLHICILDPFVWKRKGRRNVFNRRRREIWK